MSGAAGPGEAPVAAAPAGASAIAADAVGPAAGLSFNQITNIDPLPGAAAGGAGTGAGAGSGTAGGSWIGRAVADPLPGGIDSPAAPSGPGAPDRLLIRPQIATLPPDSRGLLTDPGPLPESPAPPATSPVPEPGSGVLLLAGAVLLGLRGRKQATRR